MNDSQAIATALGILAGLAVVTFFHYLANMGDSDDGK